MLTAGLSEAANPGDFYANRYGTKKLYDKKSVYTPQEVAEFVIKDMGYLGISVRIVNDPSERRANETIVALNTSSSKHFLFGQGDYHFAIQLSDGTWADKRGSAPSRWNMLNGEDKIRESNWHSPSYNYGPIFFAIGE